MTSIQSYSNPYIQVQNFPCCQPVKGSLLRFINNNPNFKTLSFLIQLANMEYTLNQENVTIFFPMDKDIDNVDKFYNMDNYIAREIVLSSIVDGLYPINLIKQNGTFTLKTASTKTNLLITNCDNKINIYSDKKTLKVLEEVDTGESFVLTTTALVVNIDNMC